MPAHKHQTLIRILCALTVALFVACTSGPMPSPSFSLYATPGATLVDAEETVRSTCDPLPEQIHPQSALWSPTEPIVALVRSDGICLYDAVALRDRRFIETTNPTQVVFSPDGKLLASVDSNTTAIRLWDVATGRKVRTLNRADDRGIMELVFAPDGKTLASKSYAGVPAEQSIQLWDVTTGQERRAISGMYLQDLVFSPDSQWLVLTGRESKLWKIATDQVLPLPFPADELPIFAPAFSPDSTTLAWTGAPDRTVIQLWDLPTGRIRQTLRGHTAEVERLVFSPDGQILASSARWPHDMTIKLWNVQTGRELHSLNGHSKVIFDLIFTPDGKTLVSSDCCSSLKLWNVQTGREWFLGKDWDVNDILLFSPDGRSPKIPGKVIDFVKSAEARYSFSADGQRRIATSWIPEHHGQRPVFELSDIITGRHWPLN